MKYYKIIDENNMSCNGGTFDWTRYLPTKNEDGSWIPGKWTPVQRVVMCLSGYHVTDTNHLLDWADAQLYECEVIGPLTDEDNDKYVCRSIRLTRKIETWNNRNLRLFACWCIRQIRNSLNNERSKNAVDVAERYALGEASIKELNTARSGIWDLPASTIRSAAWSTVMFTAWDAAKAAAWFIARSEPWDVDRSVTRPVAEKVQNQHLLEMLGIESEEK